MNNLTLGPIYTGGASYRARAEARQRKYRTEVINAACGEYGHLLDSEAADIGKNFILDSAFHSARNRQIAGKGVTERTFNNMLSSQAMCFNLFAPLAHDLELASAALSSFLPGLESVASITIEYTPDNDVFGDQSGKGGVDCDVLIVGRNTEGFKIVCVIETKFVEKEFSICGFRKPGRAKKGKPVCPEKVAIQEGSQDCFYTTKKKYKYWERTNQYRILNPAALSKPGCPFAGPLWQLWVNHVLANDEGSRRGASESTFAVLAPKQNTILMQDPDLIESYKTLINKAESVQFIDLDDFIKRLSSLVVDRESELQHWVSNLEARYAGI
jgi:hypothetical protein